MAIGLIIGRSLLALGGLIIGRYLIKKAINNYYIGRRIRNQAFNSLDPTDANFHRNISNRLHQILENNPNFQWIPIAYVRDDELADFLDEDVNDNPALKVYCEQIARMLGQILTSAAPQDGIGLPANAIGYSMYDNNNRGFFATQHGPVLRNPTNTFELNGQAQNLYYWASHYLITVTQNGNTRYYDPSYGSSQGGTGEFAQPADMARANVAREFTLANNNIGNVYVERVMVVQAPVDLVGYFLICQQDGAGGLRHSTTHANNTELYPYAIIGPISWDNMAMNLDTNNFVAQMPQALQDGLAAFQFQ